MDFSIIMEIVYDHALFPNDDCALLYCNGRIYLLDMKSVFG